MLSKLWRHGRFVPAIAVCSVLIAVPVRGQQAAVPPDPTTPLAPMSDIGVPWPDLSVRDPLEAAPDSSANAQPSDTRRYTVTLEGVTELPVVQTRFNTLSALREGEGKAANVAQINRRAKDDAELLNIILRAEGYYDAVIEPVVAPEANGNRIAVTMRVEPGTQYRFTEVKLPGIDAADGKAPTLRQAYGVAPETPVNADVVITGEAALRERLGREGFPFAKVAAPDIVVDHDSRSATLSMAVDPGGLRRFGAIRLEGGDPPFGASHIQRIARFRPGELYDSALTDDLRRALIATGLVSQVKLATVEGKEPGTVDIATTIDPAPTHTIAGEAGFSSGEGFRVEASWQDRNFIHPEGAMTVRGVLGTQQQLLGTTLRMNNFRRRDQILNANILVSHDDRSAYDAYSFELSASIARQTSVIFQRPWTWSVGGELIASDQLNLDPLNPAGRRTFFIAALPMTLGYDGSDDLLDPKRGFRLSGRVSPEVSLEGSVFSYVRAQIDGSAYYPVNNRVVIAGRARIGSTVGAARNDIAPSRLYYAGGGGSVRGYGYQEIGPRNALNQPIGGRSLAEFSLEARIRLPVFGGNFGVVPFLDAGNIYSGSFPTLTGMRLGTGLGLRYYSSFGPIRIDVGTPIARRGTESPIAVYVSLGQAF